MVEKMTERRRFPRILVRVLVDFESPDTYLYDYSNDLSEGGIFIETEKPFEVGTPLTLRFTLPGLDRVFEVEAKVAWLNAAEREGAKPKAPGLAKGMGVQFLKFDEADRALVRDYVSKPPKG